MDDPAVRAYTGPEGPELTLARGDVTAGVVRVGATVRRPAQPQSLAVAHYLDHLASAGFGGSPRYLGRDHAGRDVLDHLEGQVAGDPPEEWVADEELLASVGHLLRGLHEASTGYAAEVGFAAPPGCEWFTWPLPTGADLQQLPPPPAPELISHNDVTPQNVVLRGGRAVGLIDFDMAGPTTRLGDFFSTARYWVPLRDPADVWPTWSGVDQGARLRLLADAYGLTTAERAALVGVGTAHAERNWLLMKGAAEHWGGGWARMWDDGVGDVIRRRREWLAASGDDLTASLVR